MRVRFAQSVRCVNFLVSATNPKEAELVLYVSFFFLFLLFFFYSFLQLLRLRLSQHFTSKLSIPLDVRAGRRASLSVAETLPLMTQRTSWVRKQAYWNAMRCIDVWHHYTAGTTMYLYFVVSSIDVGQCIHLKVRWENQAKSNLWKIWICLALRRAALRQPSLVAKVADFPQPGEARDPTSHVFANLAAQCLTAQYTNVTKAGCSSWSGQFINLILSHKKGR